MSGTAAARETAAAATAPFMAGTIVDKAVAADQTPTLACASRAVTMATISNWSATRACSVATLRAAGLVGMPTFTNVVASMVIPNGLLREEKEAK